MEKVEKENMIVEDGRKRMERDEAARKKRKEDEAARKRRDLDDNKKF